jgi:hypothetical protein
LSDTAAALQVDGTEYWDEKVEKFAAILQES